MKNESKIEFLRGGLITSLQGSKINNLQLHIWTVNSIENLKICLEIGCDGVITDEPILFREYLK